MATIKMPTDNTDHLPAGAESVGFENSAPENMDLAGEAQEQQMQQMQQIAQQASTEQTTGTAGAAPAAAASATQPSAASLYVGDLQPFVVEKDLFEFFRPIGDVASVRLCRDSVTRRSLCYAYVNFAYYPDGERALEQLNYRPIAGKPCRLMWSQRDPALRKSGSGNVFIKNLDPNINNKGLDEVFKAFGEILSCKVRLSEGATSGYGFVHFVSKESADAAIAALDGVYFNDRKVSVCYHEPRKMRENRLVAERMSFTNVYVKNLPEDVDDDQLREMFSHYGTIVSAIVQKTPENVSRGFGFVNFEAHESAAQAVEALHGTEYRGRTLVVCRAQKKKEREDALRKDYEARRLEWFQKYQGSNLYVKNLDDDFDDAKLRAEFAPYGTITSCKVMVDEKNNSRGFGFVCFASPEEAVKACNEVNGRIINKKPLYVGLAQRKDHRTVQLQASRAQAVQFSQFHAMGGIPPQMMGQAPGMYPGAVPPMYYSAMQQQQQPPRAPYYGAAHHMQMRQRWTGPQQNQQQGQSQGQLPNQLASQMQPQLGSNYAQQQQHQAYQGGNGPRMARVPRGQNYGGQGGPQGQMPQGGAMPGQMRGPPGHQQRMPRGMHHGQQQSQSNQQPSFKYTASARNTIPGDGVLPAGYVPDMADAQLSMQQQQLATQMSQMSVSMNMPRAAAAVQQSQQQQNSGADAIKISADQLAQMDEESQKRHLGEALYRLIYPVEEKFAPKITGMLLDMGVAEVLELLESPDELRVKVAEAAELLKQHAQEEQ